MGIWSCRGVGRGWFWGDWRELKVADGSGLGLANMAERLIAIRWAMSCRRFPVRE